MQPRKFVKQLLKQKYDTIQDSSVDAFNLMFEYLIEIETLYKYTDIEFDLKKFVNNELPAHKWMQLTFDNLKTEFNARTQIVNGKASFDGFKINRVRVTEFVEIFIEYAVLEEMILNNYEEYKRIKFGINIDSLVDLLCKNLNKKLSIYPNKKVKKGIEKRLKQFIDLVLKLELDKNALDLLFENYRFKRTKNIRTYSKLNLTSLLSSGKFDTELSFDNLQFIDEKHSGVLLGSDVFEELFTENKSKIMQYVYEQR